MVLYPTGQLLRPLDLILIHLKVPGFRLIGTARDFSVLLEMRMPLWSSLDAQCSSSPHLSLTRPLDAKCVSVFVSRVLLQPSAQSCLAGGKSRRLPCLGVNGPPACSLFVPQKSLCIGAAGQSVRPTDQPVLYLALPRPLSHPCPPFPHFLPLMR
ncbi:hypothetical protein BDW75DRAFT_105181 [Aspergillus navahoensis]